LLGEPPYPSGPSVCRVAGLPVQRLRTGELIDAMVRAAADGMPTRVCYLNAHNFNLADNDPSLRRALSTADILYADGISVVWASRLWGPRLPGRLTSADYVESFYDACAREGLSVFLLGGRPGVADRAAEALRARRASLVVAGTHAGYFDDHDGVIDRINRSGADVLIVGMGSPRQELWTWRHADRIDSPVIWSVGALLDYLAGEEPRAPQWVCRLGCEWLFRLLADPGGKWRRYLVGNPRFVWSVLRHRLMDRAA